MRVALLAEKDNAFRAALCDVFRENGHETHLYSGEFLETATLENYDLVLLKTKKPLFLAAAYRAKGHGVKVVPDPVVAEVIRNRVLSDRLFQKAGIPSPRSIYDYVRNIIANVPEDFFPAVKKPLMSSGGRGLKLITRATDLMDDTLDESTPIYLQKFVEGKHLTVYFIGEKIYAFERAAIVGPETGEVMEVAVWHKLRQTVRLFKTSTGILWGDMDIVISDSGTIFSVDPGTFPSFNLIPRTPNDVAKEIISLIEQTYLVGPLSPMWGNTPSHISQGVRRPGDIGPERGSVKAQSGLCKKCTAILVKSAQKKSLFFHAFHKICEYGIKFSVWLYRINLNERNGRAGNCVHCLRFAKNALKNNSSLFKRINSLVDPYFDQALAKLVSKEDIERAEIYARQAANEVTQETPF